MCGEENLDALLQNMQPEIANEDCVFCTIPHGSLDKQALNPVVQISEREGLTLVLSKSQAEKAGIEYHFHCSMITLGIHSSLEAVGFLAAVLKKLAAGGISVNAISGFYHDHLFVPVSQAKKALQLLQDFRLDSSR